ncbi:MULTISPECIES: HipA family kinase [Pseudomonas]|jgi:hypothetical protein|uniref:HipA family kinase n=2 Tax=Pseudomonas TaxID=286 RepID=UPI001F4503EF|nr:MULTISPECIES: HipA family kinase [Pseudomonas]MEB0226285.1 hypothetical protein [Pseudomonas sp. 5S1]MEB0294894.1 hypothetical protein [Pseudomonas sp. 10S4]ULN84574.1 hypothetical protein HXW87_21080 [Pseudomonas sp. Y5-11]
MSAQRSLVPSEIELGLFLTGKRVEDPAVCGQHPLFYGIVQLKGQMRYNAYVKMIPARLVYAEVLASLLGRALGLPVPLTIPVYAKGQTVGITAAHVLCVASLDCGAAPIGRIARLDDVNDLLTKWTHIRTAIVFDELIANADRNLKNILLGADGKIWLIDHEEALRDPLTTAHRQIQNYLLKRLSEDLSQFELRRTAQRLKEESLGFVDIDISAEALNGMPTACQVTGAHMDAVVQFLTDRIQHMPKLLESGLGLSQTHLDLNYDRPRA